MIVARFTQPIQIVVSPSMKERCRTIADAEGVSLASVYRDCIAAGLETLPLTNRGFKAGWRDA